MKFLKLSMGFSYLKRARKIMGLTSLVAMQSFASTGGTVDGTFQVNANGEANYTIPIIVPPGTNNVAPNLAIEYGSQSANGLVGVGWNLSGLSAIARCAQTKAHDGSDYKPGINYKNSDRFCIDGQRLVNVDGDYGEDGTRYRTEIETWTEFTSYGSCGNGPCRFEAVTKDGSVLEFAATDDSRIKAHTSKQYGVRVWAINKITDRNGNYVTVKYQNDDHEHFPIKIRYTGNDRTGLDARREVIFEYENRKDNIDQYSGGARIEQDKRLKEIKTYVDDILVKQYKLEYEYSKTSGRSLLTSVEECGNSECLPKTKFAWYQEELEIKQTEDKVGGGYRPDSDDHDRLLSGDINGDGLTDLIWAFNDGDDFTIRSVFSEGDGKWKKEEKRLNGKFNPDKSSHDTLLPADINADGLADVIWAFNKKGGDGEFSIRTAISKGNGDWDFKEQKIWGGDYDPDGKSADRLLPGDIDGDGRTDLLWAFRYEDQLILRSIFSKGDGEWDRYQDAVDGKFQPDSNDHDTLLSGDVNGDGLMDIIWAFNAKGDDGEFAVRTLLSKGNGEWENREFSIGHNYRPDSDDHDQLMVGDINGDGLSDIIWAFNANGDEGDFTIRSLLSEGDGDWTFKEEKVGGHYEPLSQDFDTLFAGDVNSDGMTDVILGYNHRGEDGDFTIRLLTSAGDGTWHSEKYEANKDGNHYDPTSEDRDTLMAGDVNGDGQTDLIWAYGGDGEDFTVRTKFIRLGGETGFHYTDVIKTIKDGVGGTTDIDYARLVDQDIHHIDVSVSYPRLNIRNGVAVVESYTLGDGRDDGDRYRYTYDYINARMDLFRGWLGFRKININLPDGTTRTTTYEQDFPFTGLVSEVKTRNTKNGDVLGVEKSDFDKKEKDKVYRIYKSSETNLHFTEGQYNYTLQKKFEYDDDKSRVTIIHDAGDTEIPDDDVYNCFAYNEASDWKRNFPVAEKITASAEACGNNTSDWDEENDLSLELTRYDEQMNVVVTKRWDNTKSNWQRQEWVYDGHGNPTTWIDPLGNEYVNEYDERYQTFPIRKTSPAVSEESPPLQQYFAYDARFGIQTMFTDENNVVREKIEPEDIDDFGRVIGVRGSHPDKDELVMLSVTEFRNLESGLKVSHRFRRTWGDQDESDWYMETQIFDGMKRLSTEIQSGPEGSNIHKEYIYDNAGRIKKESLPFYDGEKKQFVETDYNIHGLPIKVKQPDGGVEKRDYNLDQRQVTVYRSSPGADETSDELVKNDIFANSRGWITKEIAADGGAMTYTYDRLGRRTQVIDARGTKTTYSYNSLGQLVAVDNPERGMTSLVYNKNGKLKQKTDALGQRVVYHYDSLNRTVKRLTFDSLNVATEEVAYDYDQGAYGKGRLSNAQSNTLVQKLKYNRIGKIITRKIRIPDYGDRVFTESYSYNALGGIQNTVYPDGSQSSVNYYPNNQVQRVAFREPGESYSTTAEFSNYDAFGNIGQADYENGTISNYYYDDLGRLESSQAYRNALVFVDLEYRWNKAGKLLSIEDYRQDPNGPSRSQFLRYDDVGRLINADSTDTYGSLTYKYDDAGNITENSNQVFLYHESNKHQLVRGCDKNFPLASCLNNNGDFRQHYNALGNLVKKSIFKDQKDVHWLYQYDGMNRLVSVDRRIDKDDLAGQPVMMNRFVYGFENERIIKEEKGGKKTFYISPLFEIVKDAQGRAITHTKYVQGPQGIIKSVTRAGDGFGNLPGYQPPRDKGFPVAGEVLYFHHDHLGSTDMVTDANGAEFSRVMYEPYGSVSRKGSTLGEKDTYRQKFNGKEYDDQIDLHYFGSRYYDANTGRFISPDPASQFSSPYLFAASDPMGHIDPDGEFAFAIAAIAIGGSAIVGGYAGGMAVNDDPNPINWDWGSGKTWAGVGIGAGTAAATTASSLAAGPASLGVSAGLKGATSRIMAKMIGEMLVDGAIDGAQGAAFTALSGGGIDDMAMSFGTDFTMSIATAGLADGLARPLDNAATLNSSRVKAGYIPQKRNSFRKHTVVNGNDSRKAYAANSQTHGSGFRKLLRDNPGNKNDIMVTSGTHGQHIGKKTATRLPKLQQYRFFLQNPKVIEALGGTLVDASVMTSVEVDEVTSQGTYMGQKHSCVVLSYCHGNESYSRVFGNQPDSLGVKPLSQIP